MAYRAGFAGSGTTGTGNRSATGTPAVGDHVVVFCCASVNTNSTPTCSDDQGGTYTRIGCVAWNASANRFSCFVRDANITSAVSTTITVATGSNDSAQIVVVLSSDVPKTGIASIRSAGSQNNQSGTTPAPALNQSALTANETIASVGSDDTTTSPPASWTERVDTSASTPTSAVEVATRDSGFTGTTITFGANQSGPYASFAIEIDCSNDGTLTKTLDSDTVAATGSITIHGTESVTLADDTVAATGSITTHGTLAKTLDDDTVAATGSITIHGTLSKTLDDDTVVATGSSETHGSLSKTLEDDTVTAAGHITIHGERPLTHGPLDDDVVQAFGTVTGLGVQGEFVLHNAWASFIFTGDLAYGLVFTSMQRFGQDRVWINQDGRLWKGTTWDSVAPSASPGTIEPDLAHLAQVVLNRNYETGENVLTATWEGLPTAGTDTLRVVVTCTLRDVEDFLRVKISAIWETGANRMAVDLLGPVPLKFEPLNQGSDFGIIPFMEGILIPDPVNNVQESASPGSLFGNLHRNEWSYPSGFGWTIPIWGYYETATKQGWMVFLAGRSAETVFVRYEGDSTNLLMEFNQAQPDMVVPANGGRALGSEHEFCIRPMFIRQPHGWADMATFYRDQIYEVEHPVGFVRQRAFRSDLSEEEKRYAVFIDVATSDAVHVLGDGSPGDIATIIGQMRRGASIPIDVPIRGVTESQLYNTTDVGEIPKSDLAAILSPLPSQKTYLATWVPGFLGPGFWDIRTWLDSTHAATERRWHTHHDVLGLLRESRDGYLDGDNRDTLLQSLTRYYRERTYTVVSWSPGTLTVTVSGGSPSGDNFVGVVVAVVDRGGVLSSIRLAQATVDSLGASTITVTGLFTNYLGTVLTPTAGDEITVYTANQQQAIFFCPHAIMHASDYLSLLADNVCSGLERNFHSCGRYVDTWEDSVVKQPDEGLGQRRNIFCFRDHQDWAEINDNYSPHPRGGGSWWGTSRRSFMSYLRQVGRESQRSNGRKVYWSMAGEFASQPFLDLVDFTFTTMGACTLWRSVVGVDPTEHGNLAVPMFAMVHAGRHIKHALNAEFSTALGQPSFPFNDPALRRYLAYCLGAEWPYGTTAPTISFFQNDTIPFINLWNESIYVSSVSTEVRQLRDFWTQIVQAELRGASEWMHCGIPMAPAVVDMTATTPTTGLAQSTYANLYKSYDVLYPRATYPRVVHACYKHRGDGSILVVLCNWTYVDATWAGVLDIDGFGFDALGSPELRGTSVRRTDAYGNVVPGVHFNYMTGRLRLPVVKALTVALVYLRRAPQRSVSVSIPHRRWEKGTG